jgi:hypothetical protein
VKNLLLAVGLLSAFALLAVGALPAHAGGGGLWSQVFPTTPGTPTYCGGTNAPYECNYATGLCMYDPTAGPCGQACYDKAGLNTSDPLQARRVQCIQYGSGGW